MQNRNKNRKTYKAKQKLTILFALIIFIMAMGLAGTSDYLVERGWVERKGILCEDEDGQYLVTEDGNMWNVTDFTYSNGKTVKVGDKVKVYFDTNGTADVADDSIEEVYKRMF